MSIQPSKFHTVAQLGEKRALTPEGFLLCSEVPVARTGTMIYGPYETPVAPGQDGLTKIERGEEAVFDPTYMASLEGKPVTDNHPEDDVVPKNVLKHFRGTMMNVRRGAGLQSDLLLADLLIMEESAIKAVQDGKVEVSLGYSADYEELGQGYGRQLNLIGNHVALVAAGRCGNRCAIGDAKPKLSTGVDNMAKGKKTFLDKLMSAFKVTDESALITALKEEADEEEDAGTGGDTHVHIHGNAKDGDSTTDQAIAAMDSRITGLEEGHKAVMDAIGEIKTLVKDAKSTEEEDPETEENLAEEAPSGTTKDQAAKARDSQYMEDSFRETVVAAEILVPGIRVPTFDRASDPKKTLDTVCKLRRTALDLVYNTADGRAIIEDLTGGKPLDMTGMKCNAVRSLFRGAVAAKKIANNATRDTGGGLHATDNVAKGGKIRSLSDLNKINDEKWGDQKQSAQ
jgi:hypothetical protein